MLSLKLFLFVCVSWNTCLLALTKLLWWWLVYWMMVGVLVAGTRSPTVRRPLSRKLSALEIFLAPECKYSERSLCPWITLYVLIWKYPNPDYQHYRKDPQRYWKDPRLSAAAAESHRYPAENSCNISSSTLGEHNNVESMHSILVMCVVSHLRCWVCTCRAHCSPLTAEQLAQHWVSDFAGEREGGLDLHRNDNDTCHPHSLIFLPIWPLLLLVCFPF